MFTVYLIVPAKENKIPAVMSSGPLVRAAVANVEAGTSAGVPSVHPNSGFDGGRLQLE